MANKKRLCTGNIADDSGNGYHYYSVTTRSYAISWYKVENQKCRILSLIIAVTAQNAVLILASIGRDVLVQKSDAISATSKSGYVIKLMISANSDSPEAITAIHKSGDGVKITNHTNLISLSSERNYKSTTIACMQLAARTDEDPDHQWSSCRNFDEVKYAVQLSKDDKSRVLFDKPIVWPVKHLVPTMNQMLTGPGKK